METVKVEVIRPFCLAGERQDLGATVEVPWAVAVELVALGKAVRVIAEPAPEDEPKPARRKRAAAEDSADDAD